MRQLDAVTTAGAENRLARKNVNLLAIHEERLAGRRVLGLALVGRLYVNSRLALPGRIANNGTLLVVTVAKRLFVSGLSQGRTFSINLLYSWQAAVS